MRRARVTAAVIIRVMTSETPTRETPTMAVAVLVSEGYAGLLPPHTVLRTCCARGGLGTIKCCATVYAPPDRRGLAPLDLSLIRARSQGG
jgi:hypothetical protein